MAKKNTTQAVNENMADKAQAAQLTAVERALFMLVKAGRTDLIDTAIVKSGMAITAEEHAAARPMSADEIAASALADIGLNMADLTPQAAKASTLAVSLDSLAHAFGKYGKHCFAADASNGTSLVTHEVTRQLLEAGKCSLPDVLKAVRQHLPQYSSTGHYNTLKRMLKAEGYKLNVWQAGFSITK